LWAGWNRAWLRPAKKVNGKEFKARMTHVAIQEQLDGKAGFLFLAKTSPLF